MKRRVWVLGLVAVPLFLIGAFFAWIKAVEARRWAAFEARLPGLFAEATGRDPRRPPLRGEAIPGNAWTDYQPAIDALAAFDARELSNFVKRHPKADRAKAEAIVQAHGKALELLRAGARRAEIASSWELEKGHYPATMGSGRLLVHLAVGKARFLLEEAKREEARDVLLDAAQLAVDMGRNTVRLGEAISLQELGFVLEEMKSLPPDPEVARALAVLDGSWPDPGRTWLNEAAYGAATLANLPEKGLPADIKPPGWRFGFSRRIMIADAADTYLGVLRPLVGAAGQAWGDLQPQEGVFDDRKACVENPVLAIVFPPLFGPVDLHRRAQLRLLRVAMGETAAIDDPFGGVIRTDGRKVWSVGFDRVDGGGVGAWEFATKGDIVLELKTN